MGVHRLDGQRNAKAFGAFHHGRHAADEQLQRLLRVAGCGIVAVLGVGVAGFGAHAARVHPARQPDVGKVAPERIAVGRFIRVGQVEIAAQHRQIQIAQVALHLRGQAGGGGGGIHQPGVDGFAQRQMNAGKALLAHKARALAQGAGCRVVQTDADVHASSSHVMLSTCSAFSRSPCWPVRQTLRSVT